MANWSAKEAKALQDLARLAGACVMAHRLAGAVIENKSDGSPVTKADREAQDIIIKGLQVLTPDIPVVAEEKENSPSLIEKGTYWLVDPLDGTKEYVKGRDEFTVNIGLIVNNEPYLGVIYAPVMDDLFYGDPKGACRIWGGVKTGLHRMKAEGNPIGGVRVITSRREVELLPLKQWLESGQISAWRICSSAYKFGLLAASEHDIFVRVSPTYEWDTAAGDAILRAVGGYVATPDGKILTYGKPNFRNDAMIAYNRGATNSVFAQEIGQRIQTGFF